MTSEADWIKEVSKTYLEEAKKTTGVPAGATEDKFDAARKEIKKAGHKAKLGKGVPAGEVKEETKECGECLEESTITNEQLLESFQHLSEEQFDALTDKYLTHLSENYTEEQIDAMTTKLKFMLKWTNKMSQLL